MEQENTPAEQTPSTQRTNAAGAVVAAPGKPVHSGGFISRGSGVGLAMQWRTFNRIANVVALCAVPAVWLAYRDGVGMSQLHAFLATWATLAAARGTFDILAHRFIPWPSLFGADKSFLTEDTSLRRRIAFWRFIWRFTLFYLFLFGVIPFFLDVLRGDPASFTASIGWAIDRFGTFGSFWNGMAPADRAQLLFILMINLFIGAIFIVPMVLMAVRQMKSYEPGDASWGVEIDHVRGQADVKEEVRKIIELWQAGDQFKQSGGKPERGLLFIGPPGTGKTMLAKAIATGFNAPFMAVPGSGFAQTFIGMDVVAVQWMGAKAKRLARKWGGHCIVFIDEIDAVGMRRAALGGASAAPMNVEMPMFGPRGARTASGDVIIESREWREYLGQQMAEADRPVVRRGPISSIARAVVPGMFGGGQGSGALNQLLVVMDGVDNPPFLKRISTRFVNTLLDASYIVPQRVWKAKLRLPRPKPRNDQVFFIGATNVPLDVLDPALTRAGRMGRQVQFRIPNKVDRADVLDFYLAKVDHTPDLDSEKRRDELARMTAGYSPAMIEQVCSIALMAAHHDGRAAFDRTDILTAMGTVESGTVVDFEYTPDELRQIAVHEAGSRNRGPRLHGRHARGLAAHDPHALGRLGRPLDGAREGRSLRPLPLRVLQEHAHHHGRARRRARLLRREHERRRWRHVQRRPPGRDHGRPRGDAARAHPAARDHDPQRGRGSAQEARRLLPRHGQQAARRGLPQRPLRRRAERPRQAPVRCPHRGARLSRGLQVRRAEQGSDRTRRRRTRRAP